VIFLKISIKEKVKSVEKYRDHFGILFPILMDEKAKVGNAYGVWSHPTTFFIDRKGMIVGRVIGGRNWMSRDMRKYIRNLLERKE
jgi:cytochrome c biogenesis protein CcmG/thiol:disulfide interchange protein DsbE